MNTETLEALLRQYVAAWNEPDPAERGRLLEAVWDEHGTYVDPRLEADGRAALDALIGGFLSRNPGARLSLNAPPYHHHNHVRFYWTLRFASGRELPGMDYGEVSPEGKVLPKPMAARLEILVRRGGAWEVTAIDDPQSNVFHKAMVHDGGILTLGGMAASLKLWKRGADGAFAAETIWTRDFGGKFSRMRDAEIADVDGDGRPDLAVATHDQGVVAIVKHAADGSWKVEEIDAEKDTFVHEIEVGDLDGDGVVEVYATPSEPNRLDGTPQHGMVTRYVPAKKQGRVEVADLGDRHAKEILVADVDGDGRDELYVAVEAVSGGQVEIRRYDAATAPAAGAVIASLDDTQTRFLTAGDVDGDGKREMVAAGMKSGLWLLRPGPAPATAAWAKAQIDASSGGFEHAALLADLDGDGRDELYAASDNHGELRRYVWQDGAFARETIHTRHPAGSAFTWNLMPVPRSLLD